MRKQFISWLIVLSQLSIPMVTQLSFTVIAHSEHCVDIKHFLLVTPLQGGQETVLSFPHFTDGKTKALGGSSN